MAQRRGQRLIEFGSWLDVADDGLKAFCKICKCGLKFTGRQAMIQHMASQKHTRNTKKFESRVSQFKNASTDTNITCAEGTDQCLFKSSKEIQVEVSIDSHQSSNQDPLPSSSQRPELPVDARADLRNSSVLPNTDENNDESCCELPCESSSCHLSSKDMRDPFLNNLSSKKVDKEATSHASTFECANLVAEHDSLSPASSVGNESADTMYHEHLSTLGTCFLSSSHSLKAAEMIYRTEKHSVSGSIEREISPISSTPSTSVNLGHQWKQIHETPVTSRNNEIHPAKNHEVPHYSSSEKSTLGEYPSSHSCSRPLHDVAGCSGETHLPHNLMNDEICSETETASEFEDNPLSVKNVAGHHAHLVSKKIKTEKKRERSSSNTNRIQPDEVSRCSKTCKCNGCGESCIITKLSNFSCRVKEAERVFETECCNVMEEFQEFLLQEILPLSNENQQFKVFDDFFMRRYKKEWRILKLLRVVIPNQDGTENVSDERQNEVENLIKNVAEPTRKVSKNHRQDNDELTGDDISDSMQLAPDSAERGNTCCCRCPQHRENSKRTCVESIEGTQDGKRTKID